LATRRPPDRRYNASSRKQIAVITLRVRTPAKLTRCLHFTAGCTTGWVNNANERSQAALERSSQDAYVVIRLTRSKAAVWTLDDVASSMEN